MSELSNDVEDADLSDEHVGAVLELGPRSVGRWRVRSVSSTHVFDFDTHEYVRQPGAGRGKFAHDGHPMRLTRVERWPKVGETFFIWLDDPGFPALVEHWRQSTQILSITPLGVGESAEGPGVVDHEAGRGSD